MAKTSADITKEADALQARLAAMRKEARKMKQLEDQKAAEAQRQEEIRFALAFVETAKGMYFRDGSRSYFDYICAKMTEILQMSTSTWHLFPLRIFRKKMEQILLSSLHSEKRARLKSG